MNIKQLRPLPPMDRWSGSSGDYVREASLPRHGIVVGLGARRIGGARWSWEVVDVADRQLRRGEARTGREARHLAEAAAVAVLAEVEVE